MCHTCARKPLDWNAWGRAPMRKKIVNKGPEKISVTVTGKNSLFRWGDVGGGGKHEKRGFTK